MNRYLKFFAVLLVVIAIAGCSKPNPGTLLQDGIKALQSEDFDGAIKIFTKALDADPQMFDAYTGRAEAYLKKRKPEEALKDSLSALEIQPDNEQALLLKADSLANTLALEEAIKIYKYTIEKHPESAKAYMMLGNLYINTGETAAGFANFKKALEINPQYAEVYLTRGVTYFQNGEYEKAVNEYSLAIEHKDAGFLESPLTYAYYNRGHAYKKLGKIEETRKDWESICELYPDSDEAKLVKTLIEELPARK
jgi:tetratricopeptide (TPR) repeat protein